MWASLAAENGKSVDACMRDDVCEMMYAQGLSFRPQYVRSEVTAVMKASKLGCVVYAVNSA